MLNNSSLPAFFNQGFNIPTLPSGTMAISLLIGFFVLFSVLECHFPRNKVSTNKIRKSYLTNIALFAFNSLVLSLTSTSALLVMAEQKSSQWLSDYLPNPVWRVFVPFLLYDLSLYVWHWASHRLDVLWLFHRVHHSDLNLNVSTAFRLHLLDVLAIILVKAAYIVLFGLDMGVLLIIEITNVLFLMFHHSNLTFKGERFLGYLIIVPYLHRVHHSTQRHEHDSNYGAVLSIWDRLFGTLVELEPKKIGIKGTVPQNLIGLIKFGFSANATVPKQHLGLDVLETMIAEAAYYRAEKRSFYPGYEICDWLEAKKEIIRQVYGNKAIENRANNMVSDFSKDRVCC